MYELSKVTKNYQKGRRTIPALRGLNLVIGDGEWLAVQGRLSARRSTGSYARGWPGRSGLRKTGPCSMPGRGTAASLPSLTPAATGTPWPAPVRWWPAWRPLPATRSIC